MDTPTVNKVSRFNIEIRTKTDNSFVMTFKKRDPITGVLSARDISGSTFTGEARDPANMAVVSFTLAMSLVIDGTDGKLRVSVPKAIANNQTIGLDLCFDIREDTGTEDTTKAVGIVYVKEGISA